MTLEDYIVQQLKDDEFAREYIRVHKPIIRCKDCKYWVKRKDYKDLCTYWAVNTEEMDFCSRGEKE